MALKEHTRTELELKFRNVHALIKKDGRPISDITWLNQLDRAKGHSKTYDNMEFISLREEKTH